MAAFDKVFDARLKKLRRRMEATKVGVQKALASGVVLVAERAVARLQRLTPRSNFPGVHIADGWTYEILPSPKGDGTLIRVFNADPRGNATIALASGGKTSILKILEFGSRPHTIEPKKKGGMLVFTARGGGVVFTKKVFHPGTRPYAMVAQTRVQAIAQLETVLQGIRKRLSKLA